MTAILVILDAALTLAQQLAQQDNVVGILGPYGTNAAAFVKAMKAFTAASRARPCLAMKPASRSSIAGVGAVPGQIALQVMSWPAVSRATARVKPISAVLVVT